MSGILLEKTNDLEELLKRYTIDLEFFLKDPEWDALEYGVALGRREEILKRKHQIPKKYLQKIQALENQFLERYEKKEWNIRMKQ